MIEDAYHAALTAKKAGYPVLAVYDESEIEQEKLIGVSDWYCKSLSNMRGVFIK